ncbi:MAG: bifunctional glycosyltransferase family 2 protein/CDP-glycerol:glycerophosphate glycerophosphotransferase [Spirochaetaceae bacterium]|nr:bifunctional glycosyltransferase family 2 protein/CDP-glycerol:glycerophosphate glycerophosphotransferase [Spirochaetaceae bacterium]
MPVPRPVDAAVSGAPELSVVVIGYNDRAHLPTAIRSVLDQTLRHLEVIVVDDASTDGSADVAEGIAAADPRVRVVRLQENSGGCSLPRNTGLDAARAPYVMFLDSDDRYDRHACKNLLLTAERTGADVVAGQVVRVHVTKKKETPWIKRLYTRRAVYQGIRENPEMFFDPLSTNKLYRRDFLDRHHIRFPEGVHYEDSLFSTKVYVHAKVIAVVPNVVYFWHVVQLEGEELSITQRRDEIDNFRDRIAVHRMMDEFLSEHGSADLKVYKDFKFIRHDLKLYLSDLPHRDDAYQREFMEMAADYLSTVSDETLALCYPVERICVHMIRLLDVTETLKAVDYLKFGFKISTMLHERDGRVYWSEKYLDTPQDTPQLRAVLDVTDMGLHRLPFERLSLQNEIVAIEPVRGRLRLEGTVLNQLGRIPPDADLTMWVSVRNRGRVDRRRTQVDEVHHEGDHLRYRVTLDLARAIGALDQTVPSWDIRLEVFWAGKRALAPFSIDPGLLTGMRLSYRGRLGGAATGTLEPVVTMRMNLAFEQAADDGPARVAATVNRFALRALWSVQWRTRSALGHPALKAQAYRLFRRLPVRPGLALFESHMGRQYSDSPRYVYEAAVAAGLDRLGLIPVWSHAKKSPEGFPTDVRRVMREGWRYHYTLARAQFWVDNQGLPRHFTRRRETVYLQTWHGTPLKRMGFDSPALERASAATRRAHRAMMKRWSALLVPSEYFVETFVKSYGYEGRLVRHGLPRNDLLVRGVDEDWVLAKKRELNLPTDQRLVLYAPTFRDRARRLEKEFDLPFDINVLSRELGGDLFLMLRTHYLDAYKLSDRYRPFAADLTRHHDVTELMLIADVLVTDYSSVMFDFANTGRPMVFYTFDYEDYVRDERGTYVDLRDIAPGPMVADTHSLVAALKDVDTSHAAHREKYAAFRERFCEHETGHAAEHVVKKFFEPGRAR